jgi:hypothetical protein
MGVSGGRVTKLSYAITPKLDGVAEIVEMNMLGRRHTGGAATHILCVGEDRRLLNTRRSVLEQQGYAVVTSSASELPAIDTLAPITLVVVCHSVEGLQRCQLIDSLQSIFPSSHILLLDGASNFSESQPGIPRSSTRPQDFVNSVADLVARIRLEDRT